MTTKRNSDPVVTAVEKVSEAIQILDVLHGNSHTDGCPFSDDCQVVMERVHVFGDKLKTLMLDVEYLLEFNRSPRSPAYLLVERQIAEDAKREAAAQSGTGQGGEEKVP